MEIGRWISVSEYKKRKIFCAICSDCGKVAFMCGKLPRFCQNCGKEKEVREDDES